jgi:hypothetical protein
MSNPHSDRQLVAETLVRRPLRLVGQRRYRERYRQIQSSVIRFGQTASEHQHALPLEPSRTPSIRIRLLRRYRHRYRQKFFNAILAELEETMTLAAAAHQIRKHTTPSPTVVREA